MAITARTLTGTLTDVQGVPKAANVQQAWIGSSKATIVDAPSTIRVGKVVPLVLSGAGAFSVSLPDSAQAGVLYSLWATWVEPTGTRRQAGPTMLGTFHLTADAQIGAVLETSDGQIPPSLVDGLQAQLDALAARADAIEGSPTYGGAGLPDWDETPDGYRLAIIDSEPAWAPGGGGGGGGETAWVDVTGKPDTFPPTIGSGADQAVAGNDSRLTDARPPTGHTHPAAQISDSTPTGRTVLSAANPADARTAIGAGTSSLALGVTSSTAKPGDWTPPVEDLPGGSTVTVRRAVGGAWPARPTEREDITVQWLDLTDLASSDPAEYMVGVDVIIDPGHV